MVTALLAVHVLGALRVAGTALVRVAVGGAQPVWQPG